MAEPLTAKQWAFYKAHRGVMATLVQRFRNAASEEDLLDWGGDGLIKAARTWDGRSAPSTWVWHCVRFEILHRLRDRRERGLTCASLEDSAAFLSGCRSKSESELALVEVHALIDALAARATPTQRRILAAIRDTDAETFTDIARILGCSITWVSANVRALRARAQQLGLTPGEAP